MVHHRPCFGFGLSYPSSCVLWTSVLGYCGRRHGWRRSDLLSSPTFQCRMVLDRRRLEADPVGGDRYPAARAAVPSCDIWSCVRVHHPAGTVSSGRWVIASGGRVVLIRYRWIATHAVASTQPAGLMGRPAPATTPAQDPARFACRGGLVPDHGRAVRTIRFVETHDIWPFGQGSCVSVSGQDSCGLMAVSVGVLKPRSPPGRVPSRAGPLSRQGETAPARRFSGLHRLLWDDGVHLPRTRPSAP